MSSVLLVSLLSCGNNNNHKILRAPASIIPASIISDIPSHEVLPIKTIKFISKDENELDQTPIESDMIDTINEAYNFDDDFVSGTDPMQTKIDKNNILMRKLVKHLNDAGQYTELVPSQTEIKGVNYQYLLLKLYDASSSRNSKSPMNRVAKKVNVKTIHVDFVSNALMGAGGHFQAQTGELYLGADYIVSKLVFHDMGGVVRHELSHAMFSNLRSKKKDSVYHNEFIAPKGSTLTDKETIYNTYISAEELYNYVSNMYWITRVDKSQLVGPNYKFLLAPIGIRIEQLNAIAQEIVEITEKAIVFFENSSNENEIVSGNTLFYDKIPTNIWFKIDGLGFQKTFSWTGYAFNVAIKQIEILASVSKVSDKNAFNLKAYYSKETKTLAKKYIARLKAIENKLFDESLAEMQSLNQIANFYLIENQKLKESYNAINTTMNGTADKEKKLEAFDQFNKTLRKFVNKSREWHKSFIGDVQ